MTRAFLPLVAVASGLLAACAGPPRLARADLVGTRWREVCPDPEIATATVRLRADGLLLWSYTHRDSLRADTVHTWAVEDGALLLRWNEGSAASRYVAGPNPDRLGATSSTFCLAGPHLVRAE